MHSPGMPQVRQVVDDALVVEPRLVRELVGAVGVGRVEGLHGSIASGMKVGKNLRHLQDFVLALGRKIRLVGLHALDDLQRTTDGCVKDRSFLTRRRAFLPFCIETGKKRKYRAKV